VDEEVVRPSLDFTRAKVPTLALHEEVGEPTLHVVVDLVELLRGVAGAEVVAPASQDRVQLADQHPHILDPVPAPPGLLLHALPPPIHAALGGPALEKVQALALLPPDRPAHTLAGVAAEEVEPPLAPGEIDPPRLVRMHLQPEPREHLAHALLGLL